MSGAFFLPIGFVALFLVLAILVTHLISRYQRLRCRDALKLVGYVSGVYQRSRLFTSSF